MQDAVLTTTSLYVVLKDCFPKQNDFHTTDYKEELEELQKFGITSISDLNSLVDRHIGRVLEIDRDSLDEEHIKWYSDEYGVEYVQERVKNEYWFAYPALLRIMLELEFGEAYTAFAEKRDEV